MTRPTALITGAGGQDGVLLAELLATEHGYDVVALVRRSDGPRAERLRAGSDAIRVVVGDVRDTTTLGRLLDDTRPTEIYNLAGFSSVGRSWDNVEEVLQVNTLAVAGLLDAIRAHRTRTGAEPRFYQASSSEMFGAPSDVPQTERTALHPRSPYGVSKSAAHLLTINYRESYDLFACSGILYNHESPLRGGGFVTRKIAESAAAFALGLDHQLSLGRLDVTRDWGYAPDYVETMRRMLQHDEPGDYVVATGRSHSLEDFIATAFDHAGVDGWQGYVTHDSRFERPAEVANLVGDASKAARELDWTPSVAFDELVGILVDHELERLSDPETAAAFLRSRPPAG